MSLRSIGVALACLGFLIITSCSTSGNGGRRFGVTITTGQIGITFFDGADETVESDHTYSNDVTIDKQLFGITEETANTDNTNDGE